jgi:hypothetical protein
VKADAGTGLTESDLFVVEGINAGIDAAGVGAFLAVAPDVNEALAEIDQEQTFWDLPVEEIDPRGTPPEGSPSWWVHRAWWLLYFTPEIGTALTHKVLHHKRPRLFPLLDNETAPHLGRESAWVQIHDDLTSQEKAFDELEVWFADEAAKRNGAVPLSRLRVHDILVWCWVTGQRDEAERQGADLADV